MITDEEILAIANPFNIDGKEFRFYHGCELIQFARAMYVLGKQDEKMERENDEPNM